MISGYTVNTTGKNPILLAANQPERFYRGGQAIAQLRGALNAQEWGPEDWVASTTTLFGQADTGLSLLPNGQLLRDAIAAAPLAWLGQAHVAEYGTDPALLVKLLDAGQRLPVHCHPTNDFASAHLDCRFGKTEAWVVIGTYGSDPSVYLGFREDVSADTLHNWVTTQNTSAMLGALNKFSVRPGDTIFVPAGLPHAIGTGVFIVELQQPTDFSVLMEWTDFAAAGDPSVHLGLGFTTALECVDRSAWSSQRLANLIKHPEEDSDDAVTLFGPQAQGFFHAERLRGNASNNLDPSFAVLVVTDGYGQLHTERGGSVTINKGTTAVVPYGAGQSRITGEITVIRCRPPFVGGQ